MVCMTHRWSNWDSNSQFRGPPGGREASFESKEKCTLDPSSHVPEPSGDHPLLTDAPGSKL